MSEPIPESKPASASPGLAPIGLRPSRWLQGVYTALLIVMALLPLLALAPHGMAARGWFLPVGVFELMLLWAWWRFRQEWRRTPSVVGFEAGRWYMEQDDHRQYLRPCGEWLVWSWIQVIRWADFEGGGTVRTVICLPDSASAEDRRRLRVWLRMGRWLEQRAPDA